MGRLGQPEPQALGEGSVPPLPGEGGGEAHTSSLNAEVPWSRRLAVTLEPHSLYLVVGANCAPHSTQEWVLQ